MRGINDKFFIKKEIENRCKTAIFWMQYVEMVALAKRLMRAEKLQLSTIKQMFLIFMRRRILIMQSQRIYKCNKWRPIVM